MVRADDDSWNIEESVGATALGAAGSRADETDREDRLFTDPYAHLFLEAASERGWERPYSAELSDKVRASKPGLAGWMRALTDWAACRTKFIDDFFVAAASSGSRQVVILAAGLDARAWRLPWPAGTVVFEIDQPGVLDFKADTLRSYGVASMARYVAAPKVNVHPERTARLPAANLGFAGRMSIEMTGMRIKWSRGKSKRPRWIGLHNAETGTATWH